MGVEAAKSQRGQRNPSWHRQHLSDSDADTRADHPRSTTVPGASNPNAAVAPVQVQTSGIVLPTLQWKEKSRNVLQVFHSPGSSELADEDVARETLEQEESRRREGVGKEKLLARGVLARVSGQSKGSSGWPLGRRQGQANVRPIRRLLGCPMRGDLSSISECEAGSLEPKR